MAFLAAGLGAPAHPLLGYLVAGFVLLAVGIAALTARRPGGMPLRSPQATRRAVAYFLVYALCFACFARVLSPAWSGEGRSPWLLALGDVIAVTLGLFAWVMALAEGHSWRDYGFRGGRTTRFALAFAMALMVAALYGLKRWAAVAAGRVTVTPDSLVFAFVFASLGSAFPEELLFRGFLQGSLDGRAARWAKVVMPALAFTGLRALRLLPGSDVPASAWLVHVLVISLPLGLWWGLMRDLAGGSLWPCLLSHFLLEFGNALASTSPTTPTAAPF
jgi:membrane protease YdiL (CAAX protease family)